MSKLYLSFYFPLSWYQNRSISVWDEEGKLINKLKPGSQSSLSIPNDLKEVKFKIDFYQYTWKIPPFQGEKYAVLYIEFKDHKELLKSEILKLVVFKTPQERDYFCELKDALFWNKRFVEEKNFIILFFGLFTSFSLIAGSAMIMQIEEVWNRQDLIIVLFLGFTSFIALGLLLREDTITLKNYRFNLIASGIAFYLSLFFISYLYLWWFICILATSFLFISLFEFRKLNKK